MDIKTIRKFTAKDASIFFYLLIPVIFLGVERLKTLTKRSQIGFFLVVCLFACFGLFLLDDIGVIDAIQMH